MGFHSTNGGPTATAVRMTAYVRNSRYHRSTTGTAGFPPISDTSIWVLQRPVWAERRDELPTSSRQSGRSGEA